nr:Gfo/Idh/MocA family oxidoreductase [Lachnospiraceae bacterium]
MISIGVIGTGRITHRFISEAGNVSDICISAVYNPREGSAKAYAGKKCIALGTDDLDMFFEAVDAVYIASPHETHAGYVKKALNAGKHVICEKPLCFNEEEAADLYSMASDMGLVLIEAVKTAYCPGFKEICDIALSGSIGRIIDVEAAFSRLTPTNVREFQETSFGGSFTELGSYVLLPVFRLLGSGYKDIRFDSFTLGNGTDGFTKATLIYPDGTMATCKTGLTGKTEGELVITGTKGYIYARSPWWLTSYFEVRRENPNDKEIHECEFAEAGLRYEIAAFRDMINGSGSDTACLKGRRMLEEESVVRAKVMETFISRRGSRNKDNKADNGSDKDYSSNRQISKNNKSLRDNYKVNKENIGIWGHRGASFAHPENTIPAFIAAANIPGIKGIEMDVQRTKDGKIVVFHDETVDRVTDGHTGPLRGYTLEELKTFRMKGSDDPEAVIPTLKEFLIAMKPYCEKNGLLINIELKTSVVRYEGIEQESYDIVRSLDMSKYIVWSSFLADSIRIIKEID